MNEEWRDVIGFEGIYAVSNMGRIMRVRRGGRGQKPGTIRVASPNSVGYPGLLLSRDGKNYNRMVHRLVAEAFLGPAPAGHEVNHKNGIKTDNRAANLEWSTHSDNLRHLFDSLDGFVTICRGSQNGAAKLDECDIPVIKKMSEAGMSQREIGEAFGVSGVAICFVLSGKTWAHVGNEK